MTPWGAQRRMRVRRGGLTLTPNLTLTLTVALNLALALALALAIASPNPVLCIRLSHDSHDASHGSINQLTHLRVVHACLGRDGGEPHVVCKLSCLNADLRPWNEFS